MTDKEKLRIDDSMNEEGNPQLLTSSKRNTDPRGEGTTLPRPSYNDMQDTEIMSLVDRHEDTPPIEIDNGFDPFWKIILDAEFPDPHEADKFVLKNTVSDLKTIHYCRLTIHNSYFLLFMTLVVIYTLFILNIKFIFSDKNADVSFDVLTIISFVVFMIEMVIMIISDPEYIISFYFFTDIISMLILIFDLSWVREAIFNREGNKLAAYRYYIIHEVLRIIRVIKIIKYAFMKKFTTRKSYYLKKLKLNPRLVEKMIEPENEAVNRQRRSVFQTKETFRGHNNGNKSKDSRTDSRTHSKSSRNRVLSLYTNTERKVSAETHTEKTRTNYLNLVMNSNQLKESKLSRRMLYLTNKRLMMLLLIMLVLVPMFQVEFWDDSKIAVDDELNYLVGLYNVSPTLADSFITEKMIPTYENYHTKVIKVNLPNLIEYGKDNTSLRNEAIRYFKSPVIYASSGYSEIGEFIVSVEKFMQIQAVLNICRIILIFIVFYLGIYYFNAAAREKILNPLEGMIEKVKQVAHDPTKALQLGREYSSKYDTDIRLIENTIQKIAYLLVLGFGEAGNNLLSHALLSNELEMDFISNPKTIYGIFGFCDIRNFTDATEVLSGDIMLFVNTIAKVVHEEVANHEGGANKNIGDAFLVVWKLQSKENSDVAQLTKFGLTDQEKEDILSKYRSFDLRNYTDNAPMRLEDILTIEEEERRKEYYFNNLRNSKVAEFSLISFLKIIGRIKVDAEVIKYNNHRKLKESIPGFKVSLGFGLHAGWAIEGAIGSHFKIDMTYLSPHVNMSARLEGLTKIYNMPLLFTNSLYNLFTTTRIKDMCRKLDRVVVRNTTDPFELYTVDLNLCKLEGVLLASMKHIPKTNQLTSFKNLRMDILSDNYAKYENAKENNLGTSIVPDMINESDYVDYDDIERIYEHITMDKNLIILLDLEVSKAEKLNKELFRKNYHNALEELIKGNWKSARALFEKLKFENPEDRPCYVLYEYMKEMNFQKPEVWQNARIIDD